MSLIAAAVAPLKDLAVAKAAEVAKAFIESQAAKLEAVGWNLDVVAPSPNSMRDSRRAYHEKKNIRAGFSAMFKSAPRTSYAPHQPTILMRSPELEARFVKQCEEGAALQYDAYVAKLTGKVGEVVAAELVEGRQVWGYSVLQVTLPGGAVQKWATRQIINCSVYGKLFNQWPTRLAESSVPVAPQPKKQPLVHLSGSYYGRGARCSSSAMADQRSAQSGRLTCTVAEVTCPKCQALGPRAPRGR